MKLQFDAEQDRLLLRVSTADAKEVLLWLTRRCVKILWPALIRVIQAEPEVAIHADAEAKSALVGFRHEKALSKADFSSPYDDGVRERPLGSAPLLVGRLQVHRKDQGACRLTLLPMEGQGVHLTLDADMIHSFCRLLQTAVAKSDWDIKLAMPQGLTGAQASASGARTVN